MFGKKDNAAGFASGGTTLVSKSTQVVGDIHFNGNLEIEGTIKGNIYADTDSKARVRVMEHGRVEGEIRVPTVVINGRVTGDVYASKHIELAARAVVEGNVHYQLIEMVKGAQVNGNLVHEAEVAAKTAASGATPAPSGASEGVEEGSFELESAAAP